MKVSDAPEIDLPAGGLGYGRTSDNGKAQGFKPLDKLHRMIRNTYAGKESHDLVIIEKEYENMRKKALNKIVNFVVKNLKKME